jgi:hypothetical protein
MNIRTVVMCREVSHCKSVEGEFKKDQDLFKNWVDPSYTRVCRRAL